MLEALWLVPAFPLAGFLVLALVGPRLGRRAVAVTGVGSVGLAAIVSLAMTVSFLSSPPAGNAYVQRLWTWLEVGGFRPGIAFYLDALSLLMTLVVTFVAFLIHWYSAEFMIDDEGYSRFFAYMNLFVASMVMLLWATTCCYCFWVGKGWGSAAFC